ncbi:MAG TPA: hypothetical protein VJK09_01875 [Candidatus Paceibacterota bacterium]
MNEFLAAVPAAVGKIRTEIVNPIIKLLIAVAVVYFLFGVVKYFIGSRDRADSQGAEEGKQHMLWGIIGVAITISAFGIVNLIANFVSTIS